MCGAALRDCTRAVVSCATGAPPPWWGARIRCSAGRQVGLAEFPRLVHRLRTGGGGNLDLDLGTDLMPSSRGICTHRLDGGLLLELRYRAVALREHTTSKLNIMPMCRKIDFEEFSYGPSDVTRTLRDPPGGVQRTPTLT